MTNIERTANAARDALVAHVMDPKTIPGPIEIAIQDPSYPGEDHTFEVYIGLRVVPRVTSRDTFAREEFVA